MTQRCLPPNRAQAAAPDLEAVEKTNTDLQRVVSGVPADAASTGESAGSFGAQVETLAAVLAQGASADLPAPLGGAAAGEQAMKG